MNPSAAALARLRDDHAGELTQARAEADARVAEARQELTRQGEAHNVELARVQQQADARLAERVDSLAAAQAAQLEARDSRIAAAEQLAAERAAERDRLEAEVTLLGEQIRALNAAGAQRQADATWPDEPAPARPASRRRPQRPPTEE